jgi:NADH:ubiquinone oxidoreductase subunit 3 (subunit A)
MFDLLFDYKIIYTSLIVYMLVCGIVLFILQFVSYILKLALNVKINFYTEMLSIYECGFDPFFFNLSGEFNVIFYRVSILFLLFDLELVLFFP